MQGESLFQLDTFYIVTQQEHIHYFTRHFGYFVLKEWSAQYNFQWHC